jgi:hypothetical protein
MGITVIDGHNTHKKPHSRWELRGEIPSVVQNFWAYDSIGRHLLQAAEKREKKHEKSAKKILKNS